MFKKYDKIHRLGKEEVQDIFLCKNLIVQEKIDGGNFRFYITKNRQIIFGSRGQQLTSNEGEYTNVAKNFKPVVEYVRNRIYEVFEELDFDKLSKYIFFGEACIKHTLSYDWDNMPLFLGFDVYDTEQEKYINIGEANVLFDKLNLPVIPFTSLDIETFKKKYIDDKFIPICQYAPKTNSEQLAEGVVIKNYDKQIFTKIVREEFKEENKKVFGANKKQIETDEEEFVYKYLTNYRIEKVILKELDKGKELDMNIMGDVIRNTYQDIIEEEWRDILNSNWTLNFKKCRKLIANRCREVLNNMIINNSR